MTTGTLYRIKKNSSYGTNLTNIYIYIYKTFVSCLCKENNVVEKRGGGGQDRLMYLHVTCANTKCESMSAPLYTRGVYTSQTTGWQIIILQ